MQSTIRKTESENCFGFNGNRYNLNKVLFTFAFQLYVHCISLTKLFFSLIIFRLNIVEHLRIPDGLDGVISDIPLPDNLTLSISCDENRDFALIQLLKEPRFVEYKSIIIYCSRRDECERVAKNLRTYFQVRLSNNFSTHLKTKKLFNGYIYFNKKRIILRESWSFEIQPENVSAH